MVKDQSITSFLRLYFSPVYVFPTGGLPPAPCLACFERRNGAEKRYEQLLPASGWFLFCSSVLALCGSLLWPRPEAQGVRALFRGAFVSVRVGVTGGNVFVLLFLLVDSPPLMIPCSGTVFPVRVLLYLEFVRSK